MGEGSSTISSQLPSTTWTSAAPGIFTSTGQWSDHWNTGIVQNPGASSPQNDSNQSSTFLSFTDPSLPSTSTPSPARANSPTQTSTDQSTTEPGRSLNVTAIAIGVTGAALLLIVCAVIAFNLRRRKQKKKVPPSAEFMDFAVPWHPKSHYQTAESITSSIFTPKDGMSFTSFPYESTKYNVSPYSPHPSTPPLS